MHLAAKSGSPCGSASTEIKVPADELYHTTKEEPVKKQREVVTKSQKVDVYLHFLPPEPTKSRSAGVLERVRLLAVGSLAAVMMTIGVMRMLG